MSKNLEFLLSELNELKDSNLFRFIRKVESKDNKYIWIEGKEFLNLSSNNYLGFAGDKEIFEEFQEFIRQNEYAHFGSTSARLLTGNGEIYNNLESKVADLYKKEGCLVFNSGYHANVGIVSCLAGKKDVIFSDKLNHASIIDGMKLSGAEFFRYKHLDYDKLEDLLAKHREKYQKALIITESVFSMDGDKADIKKLIELKNKYDCLLAVDEAHAFGIFGKVGLGICEEIDLINEVDIIIGTFGKAIGSIGAFAVSNRIIIDYLVNKARSFIYSTALPPINILWTDWIIRNKLQQQKEGRKNLLTNAARLKEKLVKHGLNTIGESQIVPVIIGENNLTVKIADKLKESGYWILPIRPPTVPEGTSRLRISLIANIDWEEVENIPEIIAGEM